MLESMGARVSSPVLVGRAEYLALLVAALARARAGEPSAVLIGGEAGVGKSRLVGEVWARAAGAGGGGRGGGGGAGRRLPGFGCGGVAVRAVRRGAAGTCPRLGR